MLFQVTPSNNLYSTTTHSDDTHETIMMMNRLLSRLTRHFHGLTIHDQSLCGKVVTTANANSFFLLSSNHNQKCFVSKSFVLTATDKLPKREYSAAPLESRGEPRIYYTKEQDQLILEYVAKYGDSPETWKRCSNALGRKIPGNVGNRYRLLMRYREKGQGAYDLRHMQRTYSKEDDELIFEYVEKCGDSIETFKLCAEALGRVWWDTVRIRYKFLMSFGEKDQISYGSHRIKLERNKHRKYTEVEDQLILTHVKTYGDSPETWKACANQLGREQWQNVKGRYLTLMANGGKGKKKWQLSDDIKLLDFIFKVRLRKIYIIENGWFLNWL